ncbi:right-handed parallel beta-helix repeat-containing protein [Burkholderia seminalis]|uniref:right-handed parallel beta-helix repeat-containing protein n=1 Tax=Burkholderia seminalis TaxID=488731 RepID=UPI001CF27BCC|nr:right-handed parallel beta-helix repeat-containing protein [Burkholderia seminalis]MCA7950371.1 right-handed parallel beta-helix repeat-containing protein [Burkholderia seminalis]
MTAEFPATYLVGSSTGLIARTLLQELVDLPTSVRRFGVMGDGVTDDTAALQVALNAGIPLYFPPGTYLYSNTLTATASIIGAGWNSILQCTTPQGQNSVIYWRNASNLKIQNLQFFSKNATAYYPDENAGSINLQDCSQFEISGCKFNNSAGGGALMRSCVNGKVFDNTLLDIWHDGIHVTKASADITITNNEVINGGDDAFAVVGYFNEGVRPRRITISNNRVVGTKYARGIAIVGAQEITVTDNQIYKPMAAGIYVASELTSVYQSYGNDNVTVANNILDTCGVQSNIGAIVNSSNGPIGYAALAVTATAGFNNSNITIVNNTIKNSAGTPIGLWQQAGSNIHVNISQNSISNAWDPNNKNGFPLTTISATSSSATLNFANNPGVAVGMTAWYFNGSTSVQIGTVLSASGAAVTLNKTATVPSGGTVIFSGVGLFGATIATTAAALSAATSLTFAATTGVTYNDNYGFGSPGDETTGVSIGQGVSGTNIAPGTFVTGVTANSVTLSKPTIGAVAIGTSIVFTPMVCMTSQTITTSAASAAGTNTLTFTPYPSARGCAVGQGVSGTNIPVGTYVTSVSGNGNGPTVTLSNNFTGSGIASGASITFTGTGGLSAVSGITLYSTRGCIVSKNQLSGISKDGIYVDGSCTSFTEISSNAGENIGCCNGFARLITVGTLTAGALLKLRGNYMAQPVNYPRAIDSLISSASWAYTSWSEDNLAQNGFVGLGVQLGPVTQTVSASPWTFANGYPSAVSMSVSGGAVLSINVSRNGQQSYATGLTNGMIDLKPGDAMTVTYSAAPSIAMIPRLGQ